MSKIGTIYNYSFEYNENTSFHIQVKGKKGSWKSKLIVVGDFDKVLNELSVTRIPEKGSIRITKDLKCIYQEDVL